MQTTLLTCKLNGKDTWFHFHIQTSGFNGISKLTRKARGKYYSHPQSCSSASLSFTTTASNRRSKIKAQSMAIILELFKYREAK